MPTVLIVEEERKLRVLLRTCLEREHFAVLSTGTGAEALAIATAAAPDLVILDLALPDVAWEDVTRELRGATAIPIVMLSSHADEQNRVRGFELGADDYVTKPFSPRELVLRVQAILRRRQLYQTPRTDTGVRTFGGGRLVIDEPQRRVVVRQRPVDLTTTEWGILMALASTPGRVCSRSELINRVRGHEFEGYERSVDSHVKNLRRKIELDPHRPLIVITVFGGGYRLGIDPDCHRPGPAEEVIPTPANPPSILPPS